MKESERERGGGEAYGIQIPLLENLVRRQLDAPSPEQVKTDVVSIFPKALIRISLWEKEKKKRKCLRWDVRKHAGYRVDLLLNHHIKSHFSSKTTRLTMSGVTFFGRKPRTSVADLCSDDSFPVWAGVRKCVKFRKSRHLSHQW